MHLLIIDDSDDDAVLIVRQLVRAGLEVSHVRADTPGGVADELARRSPDIVICDYNMPVFRAEEALEQVREHDDDIPFVLVSGQVGEEAAAAMMRAGVRDFVLKDRLAPAVQRELHEATERRQRRRAEAALRESEERFRLIAEHAQDVIFRYRLSPEPAMEYLSPAIEEITGRRPEEFYADPELIFRTVDTEDRATLEASWHSHEPGTLIIHVRHQAGRATWVEQRASSICDDAGRVVAVEGILRDITERTRLEQQKSTRLNSSHMSISYAVFCLKK